MSHTYTQQWTQSDRRVQDGTIVMRRNYSAEGMLVIALSVMVGMFFVNLFAQSPPFPTLTQDGINATLLERIAALSSRLDRLDTMFQAVLVGVVLNLASHLFQINANRKKRGE